MIASTCSGAISAVGRLCSGVSMSTSWKPSAGTLSTTSSSSPSTSLLLTTMSAAPSSAAPLRLCELSSSPSCPASECSRAPIAGATSRLPPLPLLTDGSQLTAVVVTAGYLFGTTRSLHSSVPG